MILQNRKGLRQDRSWTKCIHMYQCGKANLPSVDLCSTSFICWTLVPFKGISLDINVK